MVSLARTIRSIRRTGIKEWWHQLQYIGDAKSGQFMGRDQCVLPCLLTPTRPLIALQVWKPLL